MMQEQAKQKSMIVAVATALILASLLLVAALFVAHLLQERELRRELLEQQAAMEAAKRQTPYTREVQRPHAGYRIEPPSDEWLVHEPASGHPDLLLVHPEYGAVTLQVLSATDSAEGIIQSWMNKQRKEGWTTQVLEDRDMLFRGRGAVRKVVSLRADAKTHTHMLMALDGQPSYLMDASNETGRFGSGKADYDRIISSFNIIENAT